MPIDKIGGVSLSSIEKIGATYRALVWKYNGITTIPSDWKLYFPMNEGTGSSLTDRSGNSNTGTITGASWVQLPSGLWTLRFDGANDDVTVADSASLGITNNLTVAIWAKVTAPDSGYETLIGQYDTGANQRAWGIMGFGAAPYGKYGVYISDNGTYSAGHRLDKSTNTLYFDGTWHLFGFTFASGTLKLFVDGSEDTDTVGTDDGISSIHNSTADLTIGCGLNSGSEHRWIPADTDFIIISDTTVWAESDFTDWYDQTKNIFGV